MQKLTRGTLSVSVKTNTERLLFFKIIWSISSRTQASNKLVQQLEGEMIT